MTRTTYPVCESHRVSNNGHQTLGIQPSPRNSPIEFVIGGRTAFMMRHVGPPELSDGALDFRILGTNRSPAILSLIGPDGDRYADYTYNGSDADVDVSHGGLNLRPLDGTGAVNIWSMAGNTKLRIGSRNFGQSLDFWHSGANAYMRATNGSVIVKSPFETTADTVLGGETVIKGMLRTLPTKPASSSSSCTAGQIVWDADHIYVCTATNVWKRTALETY